MTSGKFSSFPISSIVIEREARQRKHLVEIPELADSISRLGLIHPIVITQDGVLVAGERRLTACKALGWTNISVQFAEDLSKEELHLIELEENIKRKNLPWQDEVAAVLEYHKIKAAADPDWSQSKTADAVGLSPSAIAKQLAVAEEISSGNERVSGADKFSVAVNLVSRVQERKKSTALASVSKTLFEKPDEPKTVEAPAPPLILGDFHEWQQSYAGPKFNLIHCDFPYGINVADGPRQNSSIKEHYDDSPDVYFQLLGSLSKSMENVVADSAHLIFWFSMHYYHRTQELLSEMGWTVDPFPLIWHKSDNAGVAPDPQRRPRRTYETAFFAHRGDRKLTQVGARSASFAAPGKIGTDAHMSAKPVPMLRHFLSMVCDEYSLVLDPTCGSGNALKAASSLGAASVLGIEKSPEFYTTACARYFGGTDEQL